jgi:hypothetical protein
LVIRAPVQDTQKGLQARHWLELR